MPSTSAPPVSTCIGHKLQVTKSADLFGCAAYYGGNALRPAARVSAAVRRDLGSGSPERKARRRGQGRRGRRDGSTVDWTEFPPYIAAAPVRRCQYSKGHGAFLADDLSAGRCRQPSVQPDIDRVDTGTIKTWLNREHKGSCGSLTPECQGWISASLHSLRKRRRLIGST